MNDLHDHRQNSDENYKPIKTDEEHSEAGKLHIFFGMCAGVGKTYSMLRMAQRVKAAGVDVVVGIVESHNRADIEELLLGLEVIPLVTLEYRGSYFPELALDAIIQRRPKIVLVDELAHSNIPGSRHLKRYQDVLELLQHGIDVYTTFNVQHVESRSETIRKITGVQMRETVPDSILERADAIELIDLPVEELLQRFREGKVYTQDKSHQSVENFFRKGNLTALREMALRITAERVDKDVQHYKTEKIILNVWKSSQKLLVAVGSGPYSADLIRWTRRLAYAMEVRWIAAHVETDQKMKPAAKESLTKNINLARDLGAEIISIQDTDIADGLLRIAKANGVTQILVGKSRNNNFPFFIRGKKIVKALLQRSGDIDVSVIGGERKENAEWFMDLFSRGTLPIRKYFYAVSIISVISFFLFAVSKNIGYQTVAYFYLFAILMMSFFEFGPGPTVVAALLSSLVWDFFFIPPVFTFRIDRVEDVMMIGMYFLVAVVSGYFTSRIRSQKILLDRREKRTSALYTLSKDLSSASTMEDVLESAIRQLDKIFNAKTAITLSNETGQLQPHPCVGSSFSLDDKEWEVAQWAFSNSQKAGKSTNTLPSALATHYPIRTKSRVLGVFSLCLNATEKMPTELEFLLDSFFAQISIAVEREYLNTIAKETIVSRETEKLYRTLFDSVSHELKTPITTIKGVIDAFQNPTYLLNKELTSSFVDEAKIAVSRLSRLVENLLDMTRLESQNLHLKIESYTISDIISAILDTVENEMQGHVIRVEFEDENQFIKCDFALIEQALLNIIRNAIEYSPAPGEIIIKTRSLERGALISIADSGKGFPPAAIPQLFRKFFRVPGTKPGGTGLGLSIAKGFIEAHKGTVSAQNRAEGGAEFVIFLPQKK